MRSIAPAAAMALLIVSSGVRAQRAEENALVAASDAFGTSVGLQTIGLYSPTDARGFNPTQAGNLRIEGLYFDQQTGISNRALFSGSEMRIGVAAQSYLFPSPTGIADYTLRTPRGPATLSLVTSHGPFDETTIELNGQFPLLQDRLHVGVNALDFQNFDSQGGERSRQYAYSAVLRFQPTEHFEIVPFYGLVGGGEHRELPYVYADGIQPAPQFEELLLPAQDWSSWGWRQTTAGVISKGRISNTWSIAAGAFLSAERDPQVFNDLLIGPSLHRTVDHVMDVTPPQNQHSYSGEMRLTHLVTASDHQRRLEFTVRARQVERHFGGDSVTDYGVVDLDHNPIASPPTILFSAQGRDDTHQVGLGVSYTERWTHVGDFSVGLLRSDYSRAISTMTAGSTQRAVPLLPNLRFAIQAHPGVTVYASYVRGIEDSVIAPPVALNRGEPPPATQSRQMDGGIHWVMGDDLDLVLGGFDVRKPYFNVDTHAVYRQLGRIENRGIEVSATLKPADGLKIVAGFVHNQPSVDIIETGAVQTRRTPVGPVPATINLDADYAPPNWNGWGASLQWTRISSRVETDNDHFLLPPLSTLNVGLRVARKCLAHPCSIRLDVANLTDTQGLTISQQYVLMPQWRRNYTLAAAIDL